MSLIDRTRD